MKLDEAIKHAEEVAKEKQKQADNNILFERNGTKFLYDGEEYKKCCKCSEEHKQLAEWLKDYKRLLEQEPILDKIKADLEKLASDEWNKKGGSVSQGLECAIGIIELYQEEKGGAE